MNDTLDHSSAGTSVNITENMKSDLKSAAPWMKFIGILYMVIFSIEAIVVLFLITQAFHISIILMLGVIGLGIYLSLLILRMGNSYSNFVLTNTSETLAKAFAAQKLFWMITGIMIIVGIVLSIVGYNYLLDLQETMK